MLGQLVGLIVWDEDMFAADLATLQASLQFPRRRCLTHYRPVMPFGNRKSSFRGSFHFSIVTV